MEQFLDRIAVITGAVRGSGLEPVRRAAGAATNLGLAEIKFGGLEEAVATQGGRCQVTGKIVVLRHE